MCVFTYVYAYFSMNMCVRSCVLVFGKALFSRSYQKITHTYTSMKYKFTCIDIFIYDEVKKYPTFFLLVVAIQKHRNQCGVCKTLIAYGQHQHKLYADNHLAAPLPARITPVLWHQTR